MGLMIHEDDAGGVNKVPAAFNIIELVRVVTTEVNAADCNIIQLTPHPPEAFRPIQMALVLVPNDALLYALIPTEIEYVPALTPDENPIFTLSPAAKLPAVSPMAILYDPKLVLPAQLPIAILLFCAEVCVLNVLYPIPILYDPGLLVAVPTPIYIE
jgi:hypothetical protein